MATQEGNIEKLIRKKETSNIEISYVRKLYDESIMNRQMILGKYNEIAEYTLPYTDVWDNDTKTITKKTNEINSVIISSWKDMGSFVMATMLGGKWAEAELDKKLFNRLRAYSSQFESILNVDYDEASTKLSTDSKATFEAMSNSNFMQVVAKGMVEAMNLGTGAYKMIDTNDPVAPVRFKHIPVARISFSEDVYGNPSHTFITHKAMHKDKIEQLFGKIPKGGKENYDIIEASVLDVSASIWHKVVYVSGSDEVVYSDKLSYNDTVVFRWDVSQHSVYGTGVGFELIDEFKKLKKYTELSELSAELVTLPPMGFNGSIEVMNKLNYTMGSVNFLGEANDIGQIAPMITSQNYLGLEEKLNKCEMNIRNGYISQPIGDYTDRAQTTATEVQERMTLFRNRMSGVYESLSNELLKPAFMNTFKLLGSKGNFEFDVEMYELIKLKYTNEMSKSANMETANRVIGFKQMAMQTFPNEEQFIISSVDTLVGLGELMNIPKEFYASISKAKENVQAYQQQALMGGAPAGQLPAPQDGQGQLPPAGQEV